MNIAFSEEYLEMPVFEKEIDPNEDSKTVKKLKREIRNIQLTLEDVTDLPEDHSDFLKKQAELKKEITQQENALKIARMELEKTRSEVNDGVVYSEIDGVIKAVRDAAEAYNDGSAVVEVSGGGGYYVEGSLSEMELGTVTVGQTVTINSWMTGTTCEGEIVEISQYPTNSNMGWSSGNNNVSWYPMRIFVSEEAELQAGDWVDVTYESNAQASSGTWYLETMFIRTENGKSYVMVRDEDGRLAQRWVQTGRDLWGSYTEIRGGLTTEDYIAFPYGKGVESGAKTVEATVDQFYSYY